MAECFRYVCQSCGKSIDAWSDGNPYYIDERGKKEYAYHPDHEGLARCIGNDSEHICMACGKEFRVDSRAPKTCCPKCKSAETIDTFQLEGRQCPVCKNGRFAADQGFRCIS